MPTRSRIRRSRARLDWSITTRNLSRRPMEERWRPTLQRTRNLQRQNRRIYRTRHRWSPTWRFRSRQPRKRILHDLRSRTPKRRSSNWRQIFTRTSNSSAVTYPLILPDWIGDHISCQNQQPAGYCLITTSPGLNGQHDPLERELFLLSVDGRVRRLAHHRSSQDSYWAQPRASISRDGRYVIFASDWGRNPGQDSVDPYIIDLRPTEQTPTGAVIAPPEPSTPSPPPTQTPTLPLTTLTGTIAFNIAEQQWYNEPVITQNTIRFVLHNYLGNEGCNEAYPGKYLYHFYTAPLGSTSYTRVQATQETLTGCDKFSDFIIPFSTQGTYNVAGCVALDGNMNRNICEILEAATA